jgi:hypothetical protein
MKSLIVHYKNKYPDCQVSGDESRVDVFTATGKHLIAIRKNGAGQVYDASEELGCAERHDLSPIVKESRVNKLCVDGCIKLDEKQGQERQSLVKADLESEESKFFDYNEADDYHKAKVLSA